MRVALNRHQRRAWKARAAKCATCKGAGVVLVHDEAPDKTTPTKIGKKPCPGCSPYRRA